ncbi:DUF3341 domain-containing protein [Rubrivirga sp.]|uniref:DUF3341 domain-containing protein n=1 Tax=Rubrivirga sp. TaxID=1885344 RepID=UPI003C73AEA0
MLSKIRQTIEDRGNQHVGLLAEFSDPGALVHAIEGLRERGYTQLDTYSPFPIHGMDRAMGLPVSKLGFMVFGGGLLGGFLGWALQWWTSEVDYAINISNKPLFAWESSVPVMFELTILFSALTAVGGMLALNGLPRPYNPLFNSERFSRATDDAFFVHVSVRDDSFSRSTTASDLDDLGALALEYVDHDGATAVSETGDAVSSLPAATGTPTPIVPQHTTGDI